MSLSLALLGLLGAAAAAPTTWTGLPAEGLWWHGMADPRAPLSHLTVRTARESSLVGPGPYGPAVDVGLAGELRLLGLETRELRAVVGLEGATWLGFQSSPGLVFDLLTFDGRFGLPVDLAWGPWSLRLHPSHTSAHTADGIPRLDAAEVVGDGSFSREDLELLGGRELGPLRLRAGGRLVLHAVHETGRWGGQLGGDLLPAGALAPYLGLDARFGPDLDGELLLSGQIGLAWSGEAGRLRLALSAHDGPQLAGKLQTLEDRWLGLLLGLDTTGRLATP